MCNCTIWLKKRTVLCQIRNPLGQWCAIWAYQKHWYACNSQVYYLFEIMLYLCTWLKSWTYSYEGRSENECLSVHLFSIINTHYLRSCFVMINFLHIIIYKSHIYIYIYTYMFHCSLFSWLMKFELIFKFHWLLIYNLQAFKVPFCSKFHYTI